MRFPEELWDLKKERQLAADLVLTLSDRPLLLTDKLANVIYLNEPAEALLGDRAEALVNRLVFSLLGYGDPPGGVPPTLSAALLGEKEPWRGVVHPEGRENEKYLAEASAIKTPEAFICGVVWISRQKVEEQ